MTSGLRVLLVATLLCLPAHAGAATAERQTYDNIQDVFLGLYGVSGPDLTNTSSLFPSPFLRDYDPCSCDAYDPRYRQSGFDSDECVDWEIHPFQDFDYSCSCAEPVRLHHVHDDNIRGQMRIGADLLRIVPLWQADTALKIEPDTAARDGHGCAAASFGPAASNGLGGAMPGVAGTGGSALIYSATLGAGAGSGGLSGGGGSGGSGPLIGGKSPLDDPPDFDSPIPTPLPPAGLMFLTGLFLLALGRSLRKRFVANGHAGEAGA